MFQTFDVPFSGDQGPSRLAALRAQIVDHDIDGFLVPRSDKYMGEYVAPCDERLAWLTGFTGSAGFAAILPDIAGVFVDGRYRLQVRDQVADVFTPVDWPEITLAGWLNEHAPSAVIGIDPWLHTVRDVDALRQTAKNVTLKYVPNLVDAIWTDRPDAPIAAFFAQPLEYAGEDHASKRTRIAAELRDSNIRAAVLTQPDSIAWLLNIRGADIHHNPVPQSFALLFADGTCHLFCDPAKTAEIVDHLGPDIAVLPQNGFIASLADLDGPVLIDPATCPDIVRSSLGDIAQFGSDPCVLPKARKNAAELQGARDAHLRDAVAMCQFLHWLDGASGITEIDVVSKLESFRRDTNALRDISFDTIAGSGPNGAVIHYRVTHDTNRQLQDGDLIVVDSGGQYIDGTTDITRTVAIGTVGDDERDCYTRVLQGMIAVSRARFPHGVGGNHLDALARAPLWMAGLDYDHGTGHGVGSFLCVHEGPQGLSRRAETPLTEGMILSNEPGYYRAGAFGIRIENLIAVHPASQLDTGDAHRSQLCFETLTWVPFDRRLINTAMLSRDELTWINSYHATVLDKVGPNLSPAVKVWLEAACEPL
ncbi:X-Pro aminopeptidase [Marivivens niveibacter]|uniref:X-Pro aminopeptidase n=1 Tax=Marivivens niveibacter TaxID=1930667 RepID=A0A251WXG1_9RHOB|nr:aminopeptidase P family protein [Marivivens niveibacter]OUD08754.1 X-Pro aminopeptidase [Marivivens niveibacter]